MSDNTGNHWSEPPPEVVLSPCTMEVGDKSTVGDKIMVAFFGTLIFFTVVMMIVYVIYMTVQKPFFIVPILAFGVVFGIIYIWQTVSEEDNDSKK